jgi:hypothetical protein
MREAILASMANETLTSSPSTSPGAKSNKKPMILIFDVVVLSSATACCSILPAPIVSNFPHIHLQLGTDLDCPNCPIVRCVVDTVAALSTGNFHFVVAVAKRYPHCVAKIYVPKDYNPIVLSGIVQRGGDLVTTELTVGFQFHLPYLTKEGDPTSILIATGPHVPVNMIVGLLFIQATRAVIDLSDNVAELRTLDTPPFPLEYRRAMVHVPAAIEEGNEQPVHMTNAHLDLINKIDALEHYFTSVNVTKANEAESTQGARIVCFCSSPIPQRNITFPITNRNAGPPGFVNNPMDNYSNSNKGMIDISME